MNLDAFCFKDDDDSGWYFDWDLFRKDVRTAIKFLDNVIDKDRYYVTETAAQQKKLRRIGLSVMGLADVLIRLGVRYGSPESVMFTEGVFMAMKDAAIRESMALAIEKGPAGGWKTEMWDRPYLQEYTLRNSDYSLAPMRNLFLLTQAPTGTTSLFAGVNSGIEPYFDLKTYRKDRTGSRVVYAKAVEGLSEPFPDYVVTSNDVTVEEHIAVQAAAQKYVDSSVSKTINAPESQTPEETAKAYMLAYDSGLKGLAYYRDKSRNVQVLHHDPYPVSKESSPYMAAREAQTEGALCPDCSGELVFQEGCKMCKSCGWSAC
jgi:ribonucleoside-diphosphate reductase alpha chain